MASSDALEKYRSNLLSDNDSEELTCWLGLPDFRAFSKT